MRKPTLLERSLAAIVGGLIGGFITLSIAFSSTTWHWLMWTPILIGVLAGYWRRDRGIKGLLMAATFPLGLRARRH